MSASKREGILLAFLDAVDATAGVTGTHRSRQDALTRDESPALVVRWDTDDFQGAWISDKQMRQLSVWLDVYVRGAVPDVTADPILVAAHALVMADATLRGLVIDITPGRATFQAEQADNPAGFVSQQYLIQYRHLGTALDSA